MAGPSPSQTVGPFFSIGADWIGGTDLVPPGSPGALRLEGRVLDGDGQPVPDAMVEIWQADAGGRFPPDAAPGWRGFARCLTGPDGSYGFTTVKPGRVDAEQAPHADLSVFARGLLQRLVTRVYFPDEAATNAADPVLSSIGPPGRAATLVAAAEDGRLRLDIRLQGEGETVFFAW